MENEGKIGNLSKARRERLVAEVGAIRAYLERSAGTDTNATRLLEFAAELEKEVRGKKYGLVFEEHRERVDVELDENLPVLTEVKGRFLAAKNAKGAKDGRAACPHTAEAPLNFLIEGDNLAALKLLEKTHRGKIDLIYIDPPYNTGNKDFIYNDSYVDKTDTFRHSKWLSFMKKRLELAKRLMSDKGVIFISIDDNEQANVRLLCDMIFGEVNFIANFIWRGGRRNAAKFVSTSHEYMVAYARSLDYCNSHNISWHEKKKGIQEIYKAAENFVKKSKGDYIVASEMLKKWYSSLADDNPSKDHKHYCWIDATGVYFASDISRGGGGGPQWQLRNPSTGKLVTTPSRGWAYNSKEELDADVAAGLIHFNGSGVPCKKRYLRDNETQIKETVFYKDRRGSSKRLRALMGGDVFPFPKDEYVIKDFVESFAQDGSTILDFFAGSGTTGHAVMKLNAEDGGKRKFILVTNNENGICEKVTYERLKRVIEKEGYAAALKYLRIDYVPIGEDGYWDLADKLLGHIRELVELENGIDFAHDRSVAIVLRDEEVDAFMKKLTAKGKVRVLYKGHNVMLGGKVKSALAKKGIEVRTIPDYYYPELEGER